MKIMKNQVKNLTKENRICFFIFFLTMIVACLPLFTENCINGHDIEYHLLRIESLKEGILMGKPFLRINVLFFGGRGYASSLFYPDFLLYIPALLRAAGFSIQLSYHLFIGFCFVAAYGSTYYCMKLISKNAYCSTLAAVVLTLAQYHLDDVYVRSAVGEYTAFIFLPFLIYGIYEMMSGEIRKPALMAIGFAGVLLCHTNTTVFVIGLYVVAFVFSIPKLKKNPKSFVVLILTAVSVLAITAFYWIPMLEQMASGTFQVAQSEFDLNYEKKLLRDIFLNVNPGMGISIFLLCLPRVFLGNPWMKVQQNAEGNRKLRFADFCLVMGILFTLGSTGILPWARLQRLLSFIQFPWRFFIMASVLLAFAAAIYLTEYFGGDFKTRASQLSMLVAVGMMIMAAITTIGRNDQGYYSYSDDYYSYIPYTGNVIGGEWLPESVTDRGALLKNCDQAVTDQGIAVTVTRNKNALIVEVPANSTYIDVPFIYYKGYAAKTQDGTNLAVDGSGENGQCRVYLTDVSDSSESTVTVYYLGTVLQKVSTVLSILLIVGIVVFMIRKRFIMAKEGKEIG